MRLVHGLHFLASMRLNKRLLALATLVCSQAIADVRVARQEYRVRVGPRVTVISTTEAPSCRRSEASFKCISNTTEGYMIHLSLLGPDPQAAATTMPAFRLWSDQAPVGRIFMNGDCEVQQLNSGAITYHLTTVPSDFPQECTCVITVLPPT